MQRAVPDHATAMLENMSVLNSKQKQHVVVIVVLCFFLVSCSSQANCLHLFLRNIGIR